MLSGWLGGISLWKSDFNDLETGRFRFRKNKITLLKSYFLLDEKKPSSINENWEMRNEEH